MALIVQKFGGTSLATPKLIKSAADKVTRTREQRNQVLVVVSAPGDTTDKLLELAYQISPNPPSRELDMLQATGEQQAAALLAMAVHDKGYPAIAFTAGQIGLVTSSVHLRARILNVDASRIRGELAQGKIVIVAGFQGVDVHNNITTIGRGGSDLTAVALAATLNADLCEIYTDVEGVYTADPRVVPQARKLKALSYEEMLELASLGAGVLQARSVAFAKKFTVPVVVRSSFNEAPGTTIQQEVKAMEEIVVTGATVDKKVAKVSVRGLPDVPGVAAKIFQNVARHEVVVNTIVQSASTTGRADVSFTVAKSDLTVALEALEAAKEELGSEEISHDDQVAEVSVVGVGMRTHGGVAARMFQALADEGINIQMITTSEIKISCVIDEASADKALKAIHRAFELHKL